MPHLQAISASLLDEWRRHLLADHSPYRRDCATCVQARATGFKHKTVTHKNPATLSFDVAGPFKVKGKSVEGTVGRELPVRYLLVGSYRAPQISSSDQMSQSILSQLRISSERRKIL